MHSLNIKEINALASYMKLWTIMKKTVLTLDFYIRTTVVVD